MNKSFKLGDTVTVKSFHAVTKAPLDTADGENYWKLIGLTGKIVSDEKRRHPSFSEMGERVLVEFDVDISNDYGLHCHNEQENALWLFISDLAAK